MLLLALIFAVIGFWRLLRFDPQPQAELLREVEEWFFVPTDTSPMVVVLLAAWMLYRRRDALAAMIGRTSAPVAFALFAGLAVAIQVWAARVGADDLQAFSLMAAVLASAAILAGRAGLRAVALPAVFLGFAVPFPGPVLNAILYAFQIGTANIAWFALNALGFPAFMANDQILLAGDHFEVIEGCSGLRSVQTLTMVSVLLVDLFGRRGLHGWLIVLLAPFVGFALNGVRVITLIVNPSGEIAAVHSIQGVLILLGGVFLLYGVDGLLARWLPSDGSASGEASLDAADGAPETAGRMPMRIAVALLALLAVAAWLVPQQLRQPEARSIAQRRLSNALRPAGDDWKRINSDTDAAYLGTLNRIPYVDFRFQRDEDDELASDEASGVGEPPVRVLLFEADPIHRHVSPLSEKTLYPGSGWRIEERGTRPLPTSLPDSVIGETLGEVEWMLLRSGSRRELALHWRTGARSFAAESWRALWGADAHESSAPRRLRVYRISTPMPRRDDDSIVAAHARIDELLERLAPALGAAELGGKPPGNSPRLALGRGLPPGTQEGKKYSFHGTSAEGGFPFKTVIYE